MSANEATATEAENVLDFDARKVKRAAKMRELDRRKAEANGQRIQPPTIRSAAELRLQQFSPVKWIVPGYLAEGCSLLAGRPKLGKSWLALDIGLAVAAGRPVLGGIPCEQGDVLYLVLEDNERRLQRRITKLLGAFAN